MEFGEDAENTENTEPSEEIGLVARLSKKTKTQAKEKGENGWKCYIDQSWVDFEYSPRFRGVHWACALNTFC